MTTVVAYNAGAYGTYLEWCLTTLSSVDNIVPPFTNTGSSHAFVGNHLVDINGWKTFRSESAACQFVRLHPKTKQHESLDDNMNYLCDTADSVVYLYPDRESILFLLNNYIYKTRHDCWEHDFIPDIDKIYKHWPVDNHTTISNIPNWIKREFLSLYLMPSWFDQVEWYHPARWSHPKCCVITVNQLLYDFENVINQIKMHCNLKFEKDVAELLPYHEQNLKLQKYANQDQLGNQIISAVINHQMFEWENLTLTSESWVQWQLRNLGHEIRCHGLDTFPTNSVQLKELLYHV